MRLLTTLPFWAMVGAWLGFAICARAYFSAVKHLAAWIDANDPALLSSQWRISWRANPFSRLILFSSPPLPPDPEFGARLSDARWAAYGALGFFIIALIATGLTLDAAGFHPPDGLRGRYHFVP